MRNINRNGIFPTFSSSLISLGFFLESQFQKINVHSFSSEERWTIQISNYEACFKFRWCFNENGSNVEYEMLNGLVLQRNMLLTNYFLKWNVFFDDSNQPNLIAASIRIVTRENGSHSTIIWTLCSAIITSWSWTIGLLVNCKIFYWKTFFIYIRAVRSNYT